MQDAINDIVDKSRLDETLNDQKNQEMAKTALKRPLAPSEMLTAEQVEMVARMCHDTNSLYQKLIGEEPAPAWPDAPAEMRLSAITGVRRTLDDPGITPIELHDSWMTDKLKQGWRYGEVKDYEAKTHPCLLPYFELPIEQRRKDFLFRAIVSAMVVDDGDHGSGIASAVMKRLNLARQQR